MTTRRKKQAVNYRAMVVIAALMRWLDSSEDTPLVAYIIEGDLDQWATCQPVFEVRWLAKACGVVWLVEVVDHVSEDAPPLGLVSDGNRGRREIGAHIVLEMKGEVGGRNQVDVPVPLTWGASQVILSEDAVEPNLNPPWVPGLATNGSNVYRSVTGRRRLVDGKRLSYCVIHGVPPCIHVRGASLAAMERDVFCKGLD